VNDALSSTMLLLAASEFQTPQGHRLLTRGKKRTERRIGRWEKLSRDRDIPRGQSFAINAEDVDGNVLRRLGSHVDHELVRLRDQALGTGRCGERISARGIDILFACPDRYLGVTCCRRFTF
jgi:hypothetical protein